MKDFIESILNLIYRKKCYFCGRSKYSLKMCPECFEKLEFTNFVPNRIIMGVNIYCAGVYTKELQKLIRGVKYHRQRELAYYQAKFMYDYFSKVDELQNRKFVLIPVPMHYKRVKKRKYNHMELVCEEFSKLSGFECDFNFIKRIKDTKPQYSLNRKQRMDNLSNAFEINSYNLHTDCELLLMDDICTTGSTFESMLLSIYSVNKNHKVVCFSTATPSM